MCKLGWLFRRVSPTFCDNRPLKLINKKKKDTKQELLTLAFLGLKSMFLISSLHIATLYILGNVTVAQPSSFNGKCSLLRYVSEARVTGTKLDRTVALIRSRCFRLPSAWVQTMANNYGSCPEPLQVACPALHTILFLLIVSSEVATDLSSHKRFQEMVIAHCNWQ